MRHPLVLGVGLLGLWSGCAASDGSSGPMDLAVVDDSVVADQAHPTDLKTATDLMMAVSSGCNPANETLGAAGGPDTCAYGQRCDDATNKCVAVSVGTCAMASGAPAWNSTGKLAPVITHATASLLATTNATTECANGDPAALIAVDFYAPQFLTTMDMASAFLQQVKWKKTSAGSWYSGTFARMLPTKNQKFGSFQVGINCGGASGSSRQAAVYVTDEMGRVSNTVCVSW